MQDLGGFERRELPNVVRSFAEMKMSCPDLFEKVANEIVCRRNPGSERKIEE